MLRIEIPICVIDHIPQLLSGTPSPFCPGKILNARGVDDRLMSAYIYHSLGCNSYSPCVGKGDIVILSHQEVTLYVGDPDTLFNTETCITHRSIVTNLEYTGSGITRSILHEIHPVKLQAVLCLSLSDLVEILDSLIPKILLSSILISLRQVNVCDLILISHTYTESIRIYCRSYQASLILEWNDGKLTL